MKQAMTYEQRDARDTERYRQYVENYRLTDEQRDLVERNIRLAFSMALNHRSCPPQFRDDAAGQAMLGLMRAAQKFDPTKGNEFSTYAAYWIKRAIQRFMLGNYVISLPSHAMEACRKDPVIAARVDAVMRSTRFADLDIGDGSNRIAADDGDQRVAFDAADVENYRAAKDRLPETLRRVIERRSDGETLQSIAEDYGVTRERVRQWESQAILIIKRSVLPPDELAKEEQFECPDCRTTKPACMFSQNKGKRTLRCDACCSRLKKELERRRRQERADARAKMELAAAAASGRRRAR